MARFCANVGGEIIEFRATFFAEKQFPVPASAAFVVQFDEATNTGLVSAYNANSGQFAMSGGTLTQSGIEVTINPPEALYRAFQNRIALKTKSEETNDPFTREELAQIRAAAFRGAGLE